MSIYNLPPLLNPLPKNICEEYEVHIPNIDKINEIMNSLKDIIPKFIKELPFSKIPYEIHEKYKEIYEGKGINEIKEMNSENDGFIISIIKEEIKEYNKKIDEIINKININLLPLNKRLKDYYDQLNTEYKTKYANQKYKLYDNPNNNILKMKYNSLSEISSENKKNLKIEMSNILFDKNINEIIDKYISSPISNNLLNMKININKDDKNPILISLNVIESIFLCNNENEVLYPIQYNEYTKQIVYDNIIINKFKNPQSFYRIYYQNLIFQSLYHNNEKMYIINYYCFNRSLNFNINNDNNFSIIVPKIVINNKYIIPIIKVHFLPNTYEEEYNDNEIELYDFLNEIKEENIEVRFIHLSYNGRIRNDIDSNIEELNLKHEKHNLENNIQYFMNKNEDNQFVYFYNNKYVNLIKAKDSESNFTLCNEFMIENEDNYYQLKYKKSKNSIHTLPFIKVPYCLNYLQFQDCPLKDNCAKIHIYPLIDIGYYLYTKYKNIDGKIEEESVSLNCKSYNICSDFLNGCCKSSYGSLKCKKKHCSQSEALKLISNSINI